MNQIATLPKRSLVDSMASKYDMEPAAFVSAIKATVIKGDCSNEQFAAFLMVAKEYDLNPLTKEIYAFPDRGGITPIVSIDGWMNLINSHPQFDGMEFVDTHGDDGKLYSVECRMYRKDRARPISVIEYMSECSRSTDPWKKWPNRMLRHKAAIQCARYAFGFSGIMEPDEFERMKDVTPQSQPTVLDRLQAHKPTHEAGGEREGFDMANVTRETEELSSGQEIHHEHSSPAESPTGDGSGALVTTNSDRSAAESSPATADEAGSQDMGESESEPASVDPDWLKTFAKAIIGAIGEDEAVVVNQSKGLFVEGLSDEVRAKAKSITNYARACCRNEIELDDCRATIAGVVGCEEKDLAA
ncbi:Bacteriophage recombination protein [Nitratireductor aquimarinus]|uniref:recombinase RecT n=1 Tax=Nitratireductor aquimarinus TaxID=889300 RepID=UPI003B5BFD52